MLRSTIWSKTNYLKAELDSRNVPIKFCGTSADCLENAEHIHKNQTF